MKNAQRARRMPRKEKKKYLHGTDLLFQPFTLKLLFIEALLCFFLLMGQLLCWTKNIFNGPVSRVKGFSASSFSWVSFSVGQKYI
jgi:hypothetical protein